MSSVKKRSAMIAALLLALTATSPSLAEVSEQSRAAIDKIIGAKGTYASDEDVYKIVPPREAATSVWDYQTLSPNIGLNSWVAFISAVHHEALLTGQLLLLEDEVDPVMTAALDAGLNVTGLSDGSVFGGPRRGGPQIKVLDVSGTGTYQDLASGFHNAFDQIRRTRADINRNTARYALPELSLDSAINAKPLNTILSMRGTVLGGVYRAVIGRRALLYGEPVGREMGISTWIAVSGTDSHAVAQGEFTATSDELHDLLKALRSKDFHVTTVRNHMADEHPQYLFVRFWKQGDAVELAKGLRYALDVQVGANETERGAGHEQ
jgi:hypothetical protein